MHIRWKNRGWLLYVTLFIVAFTEVGTANAQVLIIGNKNLPFDSMTKADVAKIWLGKRKSIANSGVLTPVDLENRNKVYIEFYKGVLT